MLLIHEHEKAGRDWKSLYVESREVARETVMSKKKTETFNW
jgi:hypothetical protein